MKLSSSPYESVSENKEFSPKDLVMSYYKFVDIKDFESLYSLFSDDVVYKRCEQEIRGIEDFRNFYENERKINGKHTINDIIVNKKSVVTRGVFTGINSNNESIELEFADFFEFDISGKINKRFTYLANGYESTK